ncbi:l-lysine exporter LysE [Helicobacter bilis]|uniref:L-lysine exporter LysE n=1 Tax=Helicobacter bilis TaxID=37372 RepID=A0A1Q2LJB0_9HELI|nr:LysE/ArgO family amino acid transporter [Helicobacter bilis]AQQ60455.1 l-lysine exporter LysE [Helicobacter bilis]
MEIIFFKGFLLSLSLIVAIGAQNIFIIKQAMLKNHIFAVCLTCFLCDVILMFVGIFGVGEFLAKNRILNLCIAIFGSMFVFYYGIVALKSAFSKESVVNFSQSNPTSLKKAVMLTLMVTLLNPHVYLDTVFVVGASALMFNVEEKMIFACGSLGASCLWFFSLGYSALKLSSLLVKMARVIDVFVALIMFFIFLSLISYILSLF